MSGNSPMPAYFAIVSKRDVRKYTSGPIPDDVIERMLQAGRATGSASNRQPWRFYVIRNRKVLDRLAEMVYEPDNLKGCQVAIAIVMTQPRSFDGGRAAQNIALAAWADGVGTCPNGLSDEASVQQLLDLDEDWDVATILSAGYPDQPVPRRDASPEGLLERINRKPLDELTHWID